MYLTSQWNSSNRTKCIIKSVVTCSFFYYYYYYSRCKHPLSPNLVPRAFPHKKRPTLFLREKPWGRGCFSPRVFVRISLRALGSSGRKRERARARETREGWQSSLSPRVSPFRAPVFSCAHYFQAPATQAILVYSCRGNVFLHYRNFNAKLSAKQFWESFGR